MNRKDNTIQVIPGQVRVNDVWAISSGRGHLVLEADCATKYPDASLTGTEGNGVPLVFLIVAAETLHAAAENPATTQIILPARTAGWAVMAEAARYTVRIAAWKHSPRGMPLWLALG